MLLSNFRGETLRRGPELQGKFISLARGEVGSAGKRRKVEHLLSLKGRK